MISIPIFQKTMSIYENTEWYFMKLIVQSEWNVWPVEQ